MGGVRTAAAHALLLAALGGYLTFVYTSRAGEPWALKDYIFVAGVALAVFYNRLSTMRYEALVQGAHADKRRRAVAALDRIEWVHGAPVEIQTNKVTVLLFFGTWCADSRAALQTLQRLRKTFTHGAVEMVALTQERREELAAYEQKGRNASHFQALKEFPFSIAIEDGLMSKEFLVRFEIYKIPHLFVVGKDRGVVWYGAPSHQGLEEIIRGALAADNVPIATSKALSNDGVDHSATTAVVSKKED